MEVQRCLCSGAGCALERELPFASLLPHAGRSSDPAGGSSARKSGRELREPRERAALVAGIRAAFCKGTLDSGNEPDPRLQADGRISDSGGDHAGSGGAQLHSSSLLRLPSGRFRWTGSSTKIRPCWCLAQHCNSNSKVAEFLPREKPVAKDQIDCVKDQLDELDGERGMYELLRIKEKYFPSCAGPL